MTKLQNWGNTVSKLIAKAWLDSGLYNRLIAEPATVLREAGMILDDFCQVRVNLDSTAPGLMADGGGALTINLPPKPTGLADELLNCLASNLVAPACSSC